MSDEDRHLAEEYGIYSSRKKILEYRWEIIKSYLGWEDLLGCVILAIGISGYFYDTFLFINELRAELVGIGIAVLIIDNANEAIKRREEKKRLILQMGSPDNSFVIEAVRQLRERGWLVDGSLHGANLRKANLLEADLSGVDMREANLGYADLRKANLGGADMRKTKMWGAKLREANLGEADLRDAILSYTDLCEANLSEADLRSTYLWIANLGDADLREANLRKANLRGANLRKANLEGADLSEARFYMAGQSVTDVWVNADLRGAILRGVNLRGAEITLEQLHQTKSLEGAILPDGTEYHEDDNDADGKKTSCEDNDMEDTRKSKISDAFFVLGAEYFVLARYSASIFLMPICGNLYHHSIEMLLKGSLSRDLSTSELKEWGHNLVKLWEKFMNRCDDESLSYYNGLISSLNKFERIRYPDSIVDEGYEMAIGLGVPGPTLTTDEDLERYEIKVEQVDGLVEEIFIRTNINPKFYFRGLPDDIRRHLPPKFASE